MRFQALVVIFFGCISCYGQDWQTLYRSALQSYQQKDYSTAINEAEKVIALASTDRKGQAYARQIITASCLETELYDKGITQVLREIEDFHTLEPNGQNYQEALHKKGQLQMGIGNFEAAAQTFHEVVTLQANRSGTQSLEYFVAQAEEADALMQAKKYSDAQLAYESCIAGFRNIPDAGEDFLYALFNSGHIDYIQSNKTSASKKLKELIAFLEGNQLTAYAEYQQAREMLSSLNVGGEGESSGFLLPADRAKQLFDKAFSLQQNNTQEALQQYVSCEKIIVENQIRNNVSFSCYLNHARLLFATGAYQESGQILAEARNHAAQLYAENSAENGHVEILTADVALHANEIKDASRLYQQGIQKLRLETTTVWLKQIKWVAEQLIAAKAGEEAIPVLSSALLDKGYPGFDVRDKIILHQLNGRAHFESRQSDKFIQYVKQVQVAEKNVDVKQTYHLLLAQAEYEKGNLTIAHELLLKGVALAPAGVMAGELYYESARSFQRLGDYKEAEIQYRKALEYIPRSPSSETVMPLLFNSLAMFYIHLGNYSAAEKFFLNLLANENGSLGFYNSVRQNLAALYQQTGRYNEAKSLLLKTLHSDALLLLGSDHPDYAIALQNLAAVYQKLHHLDSAQLLYEKALAVDQKLFGEQSLSFATKLSNLGTVYQESNNFTAARTMFEKALSIRKNLLPSDHPDYAYSQYTLANLLYRTQKPTEAMPLFKAAAEFYIKQIHDVFPALSDYERTAFYNRVHEIISTYEIFLLENIHLEKGLPATLLNFRLQTKALLLNSSLKVRNQILQSGHQSLINDFNVWQHNKEHLAFLLSLTKDERAEHAALIEEFTIKANDLEKSLSLQSENFSTAFVREPGNWQKVQAVLKPGEGALEIIRVKLADRDSVVYAAIVVKPGLLEPAVVVMPDGNFLEQKGFNRYINSIRFRVDDLNSYNLFWKKLEPMLSDVHTLYFSPDGVYTKINCVTLFDPSSKEYVIDRRKVMLTSNLQDLVTKSERKGIASNAMLIGYPDYRMNAGKRLSDFPSSTRSASIFSEVLQTSLAELPGTEKEVDQIQSALQSKHWTVQTHMRENALEEVIKAGKDLTLLHIATHGFFVAPKDEHAKQVYSNDLNDIENSSMLRSGLLLAGVEKNMIEMLAGQPKVQADDGILTAYEVMNLNLDDVDLVVLSACETGKGDVKNGEGVYGLQRAFMLAGVKHVMMSLWKVDDEATQRLMSDFYTEWLSGKGKLDAFHDVQIKLKQKFPEPYYWGAFVMMGR